MGAAYRNQQSARKSTDALTSGLDTSLAGARNDSTSEPLEIYNKTVNSKFPRLGIITTWQTTNMETAFSNGGRKWIPTCAVKMAGWRWQVCFGCVRVSTALAPIQIATSSY